jgi:hypothetical protein
MDDASAQIDAMIAELEDWRGARLAQIRRIITGTDDGIIEEWKWMGSPCWSRGGLIAVANPHRGKVKVTFAHGARLDDPKGLFNGKDTGNTRRSIDVFVADEIDVEAFAALVRAAIAYNLAHLKKNAKPGGPASPTDA